MAHPAFDFDVVTPDGSAFRGRVVSVRLPGKDGSFGILARHAPLVGALEAGLLYVEVEGGKRIAFVIGDGFVEARKAKDGHGTEVRVLVDFCEARDKIDVARAERALARAKERLKSREKIDRARAEAALRRANARLTVANFTLAS